MAASDARRTIEAVWRIESARLIAGLARLVHDVGLAEELAQDSLVAALEQWPESGVPRNPGAWLMLSGNVVRSISCAGRSGSTGSSPNSVTNSTPRGPRRMPTPPSTRPSTGTSRTTCCAWCSSRAIRCCPPRRGSRSRSARLSSVVEVLYLVFNEGYSATAGDDWMRPALCEEALRPGRILAELTPGEPEVHGLVALMEIQASRLRARTGPSGEPVLLLDQDRARWDHLLIQRGLAALERAEALGGARGPYALQAAIAACHARARTPAATDWVRIAALYAALAQLAPSPVVELNRAVALSMAFGPAAGLELVDELASEPSLKAYHLLPSVRGDLLAKLGRFGEAHDEFERAASLTRNGREHALLAGRAAECARISAGRSESSI